MPDQTAPVLVEIRRNGVVESAHRGAAVAIDKNGGIVAVWGDPHRATFPRSAVKPLQALPLLETGAFDHFRLTGRDLALACASHGGEPRHTQAIAAILGKIGASIADLECGAHLPSHLETAREMARLGLAATALHNNCSGKHAGFLALAKYLKEPSIGYIQAEHPVQRQVNQALGEMCGIVPETVAAAIDGCGIPTLALPLSAIATGMARLADPSDLGATRKAACLAVRDAMTGYPFFVAGSGRLDSLLMDLIPNLVVKGGAEGVYAAACPAKGLGIALKIEDGAGRAAEIAILALLRHLGIVDEAAGRHLADRLNPAMTNWAGTVVGEMAPAF